MLAEEVGRMPKTSTASMDRRTARRRARLLLVPSRCHETARRGASSSRRKRVARSGETGDVCDGDRGGGPPSPFGAHCAPGKRCNLDATVDVDASHSAALPAESEG